ncbi:MAG TPA: alpha-ketoglutarate-dependent dioxygenase AlkB [Sphingomonadaceae bacterium]|nr:alpha-ketoglutarate-dependent dioxygenase AlkB [Sphingomonadaceae bacterium]
MIAKIDAAAPMPFRFHGWTGKRLTRSYGWIYDFGTGAFAPTEPIPDWLQAPKIRAADFAGLSPAEIVQALIIRYDPGAGIGWHKDRPVFEHVIGISLGASATLRLRRRLAGKFERTSAALAPAVPIISPATRVTNGSTASLPLTRRAGRSPSGAFRTKVARPRRGPERCRTISSHRARLVRNRKRAASTFPTRWRKANRNGGGDRLPAMHLDDAIALLRRMPVGEAPTDMKMAAVAALGGSADLYDERLNAGAIVSFADDLPCGGGGEGRTVVGSGVERHMVGDDARIARGKAHKQHFTVLGVEFPACYCHRPTAFVHSFDWINA